LRQFEDGFVNMRELLCGCGEQKLDGVMGAKVARLRGEGANSRGG